MFNDLIFGVLSIPESHSRLFQTHVGTDLHRRNRSGQVTHTHQIVGRAGEGKNPVHLAHSAMPNLAHQRNRFQPSEALFNALPFSLTDGITCVPRGATINRAAARAFVVLRHLRRHLQVPALFHEVPRVEPFVSATVTGRVPGSFSSMISAASRSAVPLA